MVNNHMSYATVIKIIDDTKLRTLHKEYFLNHNPLYGYLFRPADLNFPVIHYLRYNKVPKPTQYVFVRLDISSEDVLILSLKLNVQFILIPSVVEIDVNDLKQFGEFESISYFRFSDLES